MADGLCTEDTVSGQSTVVVKDYVRNKCGVNELDLVASACENVKSFFLDRNRDRDRNRNRSTDTDSDCGKVCGVPQLQGPKHEDTFLVDMPCPSPDDDCRKKRCADRYDSSESSDSGVATLSCTDCSTYSGGSTASSASDITDPGSPFSTASSHSEDSSAATASNSQVTPTKMPPNTQHPPWPWSSSTNANTNTNTNNCSSSTNTSSTNTTETEISNLSKNSSSPPLKRSNSIDDKTATHNNNNLNNNHTHSPSNNKRIRTEANNATSTKTKTQTQTQILPPQIQMCTINNNKNNQNQNQNQNEIALTAQTVVAAATKRSNHQVNKRVESTVAFVVGGKIQQGKITEYFKAQMKPNTASIKRDLTTAKNLDGTQNVHKYFTLVDGPKVILDNKSTKFPPYWNKLNVRTLAVATPTTPVKKVILDTKTKKITQLISGGSNVPRKILPAPPARKGDKQQQQQQPMVKLTALRYQQLHECPYMSPRLAPVKPPNGKKLPITNLNLTVSSTVVPIVKLNNLPSKLNGSNLNSNTNHLSVSVETAVPTVPTAKPKSHNNHNNNNNNNSNYNSHSYSHSHSHTIIKKSPSVDSTTTDTSSSSINFDSSLSSSSSSSSFATPLGSSAVSVADSDSGFGSLLTISVASSPTSEIEPQKSPILSQPKTIRFPAKQSEHQRRQDNTDSGLCRWQECHAQFDTSGALLEHLQIKHVISQATQEHYVCLWVGCKVHGRTSCSRSWLERHVLGHAGNKPFRCIVDGCGGRFSSQQTLEKHVNSHFNSSESNSNGSTRKSLESGTTKLFKRNGKKLRYRRQPWSARMFDFFDAGIMEGLQHQLISMTEKRTSGDVCNKAPGDSVTLHSRILARRTEPNGDRKVLLKWHPPDIVADEWVLESKSTQTKTVSIPALEPSALDTLGQTLFPTWNTEKTEINENLRRNRRKRNTKCS